MTNNVVNETDHIFDPVKKFQNSYKELHHQNATDYFNDLVEKSKVDVESNKETIKQVKKLEAESRAQASQIKKYSSYKGLLIFLTILSIAPVAYGIYYLTENIFDILYLLMIILGVILFVVFIIIIVKKISPKIKELKDLKSKIDEKLAKLISVAWQQMAPLNALFTYGMSAELFRKTIPQIKLDKMFDSKRLDYLVNKFGLEITNDRNRSALYVQSGEINGNPLYICNDLIHYLGTKSYSGSITISWTTTSRVNGKTVTNHHTQTLVATIEKPCPYYSEKPYLVYGNESAPDLSFQRQDSDAENLSQKRIDSLVHKDIKKLNKLSEKSLSNGSNYTVMGNSEFEVLFGAKNRDNEVQFRLLFTPLAQQQLLELMKDKEIGYGDDFDFVKRKMINYIYPEQLAKIKLNVKPDFFKGYDLDAIRENFLNYNDEYLKHIYFTIAPILSIPLYQQQKPHEYIYKDLYDSYVSFYEHEKVVNMMNISEFSHPLSSTRNILKTSVVKSRDYCDTVRVTSYGYRTEPRITYVTKYGGDGRNHSIPVHWTEYIPVQQDSDVAINVIQETKEETYADKFKNLVEGLKNKQISEEQIFRISSLIAYTIKK